MKLSELKKIKILKTKEDADNILRASLLTSQFGKVVRTAFNEGMYTIEFTANADRLIALKDGKWVLVKGILELAVTSALYLAAVDTSISEIRIICRVGEDTHTTITPCDFLLRINEVGMYAEVIKDWLEVTNYQFVGGKEE